jgi:hypothetical protein
LSWCRCWRRRRCLSWCRCWRRGLRRSRSCGRCCWRWNGGGGSRRRRCRPRGSTGHTCSAGFRALRDGTAVGGGIIRPPGGSDVRHGRGRFNRWIYCDRSVRRTTFGTGTRPRRRARGRAANCFAGGGGRLQRCGVRRRACFRGREAIRDAARRSSAAARYRLGSWQDLA